MLGVHLTQTFIALDGQVFLRGVHQDFQGVFKAVYIILVLAFVKLGLFTDHTFELGGGLADGLVMLTVQEFRVDIAHHHIADIWLAETLSSLAEARFWANYLPDDGKPQWLAFTLEDHQAHATPLLRSGETVREAAETAVALGAAALLFNCSYPEEMDAAVAEARSVLDQHGSPMRLGVYANAFEPSDEAAVNAANEDLDTIRNDTDPPYYLQWAKRWLAAGADTVGGCCGIGPEHIAVLAEGLKT